MGKFGLLLIALTGCCLTCGSDEESFTSPCQSDSLKQQVDKRVAPVLCALKSAARRGEWHDQEYHDRFYQFIQASDATATEAKIALMAYYVGEHYAEELVCAVLTEGVKILPVVQEYRKCRPASSAEPIPKELLANDTLYKYAIERLRAREKCQY